MGFLAELKVQLPQSDWTFTIALVKIDLIMTDDYYSSGHGSKVRKLCLTLCRAIW